MQKIREGNAVTDAEKMQETSNKAGQEKLEELMGTCQEPLSRQKDEEQSSVGHKIMQIFNFEIITPQEIFKVILGRVQSQYQGTEKTFNMFSLYNVQYIGSCLYSIASTAQQLVCKMKIFQIPKEGHKGGIQSGCEKAVKSYGQKGGKVE